MNSHRNSSFSFSEVKESLEERLLDDLQKLGMPTKEFDIEVRKYSSSYYGNYLPKNYRGRNKACVRVYPFKNKMGDMYPYDEVLVHAIHEVCHHLQYRDPNYTRKRGIMHDASFYRLLRDICKLAKSMSLINEAKIKIRGRVTTI